MLVSRNDDGSRFSPATRPLEQLQKALRDQKSANAGGAKKDRTEPSKPAKHHDGEERR
jgi:hypothetical protein